MCCWEPVQPFSLFIVAVVEIKIYRCPFFIFNLDVYNLCVIIRLPFVVCYLIARWYSVVYGTYVHCVNNICLSSVDTEFSRALKILCLVASLSDFSRCLSVNAVCVCYLCGRNLNELCMFGVFCFVISVNSLVIQIWSFVDNFKSCVISLKRLRQSYQSLM